MPWTKRCCGIPGRLRMNKLPSIPETFIFSIQELNSFFLHALCSFVACRLALLTRKTISILLIEMAKLKFYTRLDITDLAVLITRSSINHLVTFCDSVPSQVDICHPHYLCLLWVNHLLSHWKRVFIQFSISIFKAPFSWRSSLGATSLITKSFKTSIMVIQR